MEHPAISEANGSGRPLRVAIVTSNLGGGTGHHVLSLLRHWEPSECQVTVLSESPPRTRVDSPVPIEPLRGPERLDRFPLAQIRRFVELRRRVAASPPQILHCYFFWPIIYGRLLKALGRVEILVENREDEGFGWGWFEYWVLRRTRSVTDRVICVSEAVRREVLRRERLVPSRAVVAHNGVGTPPECEPDARRRIRDELGLGEDQLVVGTVASFRAVKRVDRLLRAAPAVVRAAPAVRFVLFGQGERESELRSLVRRLKLEDRVIFAGFRTDIDRCYEALDVSALTSQSEGLSLTLLESMSHGLPVVATRVGGNPEVVVDGETGYLVEPDDEEMLADRLVRLLGDPARRARMGRAARERLDAHFRISIAARRYLDLYAGLLRYGDAHTPR